MKKLVLLATLVMSVCVFAGTAAAQDKCSDVLEQGTFKTSRYRDNAYFKQIIYSRFLSSSYKDSKDKNKLGFGVPVGDIVIGGDYSNEEFEKKKEQIRRENYELLTASREIDVALASGDEVLIGAWRDCMRTRKNGISLIFKPVSNTEVFATLEWFGVVGVNQVQLKENISLPTGAVVKDGKHCFSKDNPLENSAACRATIIFPDAFTTWPVSVNTVKNGGAEAYLPPRVEPKPETRNYEFDLGKVEPGRDGAFTAQEGKDNLFTKAYRTVNVSTKTIRLTEEQIKEGWSFDPASANVQLNDRRTLHRNGCAITRKEADLNSFTYAIRVWGRNDGRSANSTAVCDVTPSIKMVRTVWVPIYPSLPAKN